MSSRGAWDNAKKLIEAGKLRENETNYEEARRAAVIGDTVGGPFKDVAGPSLHIVVKLVASCP